MSKASHYQTAPEDRIALHHKLIYGLGAFVNNLLAAAIGGMLIVLNLGLGMNPALVGLIGAMPRLVDAITDPLMGYISDNTRSRWGRRRPYIFGGAIAAGIIFALLWQLPLGKSDSFYFVWFLVGSLIFYLAYTIFATPWVALGYELTPDYHERTRLMGTQNFIGQLAYVVAPWFLLIMQSELLFDDMVDGAAGLAVIIGIVAIAVGVLPAIFLRERFQETAEQDDEQQQERLRSTATLSDSRSLSAEVSEPQSLQAFVGAEADYYLEKWTSSPAAERDDQVKVAGAGFNWSACLLTGAWLLYRKMYLAAGIVVVVVPYLAATAENALFVSMLGMADVPTIWRLILGIVVAIFCGAFGNHWYLSKARKAIADVSAQGLSGHDAIESVTKRGGTIAARWPGIEGFFGGFAATLRFVPFRKLCIATFLVFNGFMLISSFQFYVIIYYVFGGDKTLGAEYAGYAGTLGAISTFIVIFFVTWLGTKIGKRRTFYVAIGVSMLGYASKWVCYNPDVPWLLLLPAPLLAFGLGGLFTLMPSMIADVVDMDELKTYERREGMFGAIFWWVVKLGMAAALAGGGFLLNATGFDVALEGDQSERTIMLMRFFDAFVPFVASGIAIWAIASFSITEERAHEVRRQLEERRGKAGDAAAEPA